MRMSCGIAAAQEAGAGRAHILAMTSFGRAKLENGLHIPLLGLGTYKLKDAATLSSVVDAALASGYRLIDTASVYKNEGILGQALADLCPNHGLSPNDVFITSKLAPSDHGFDKALAAYDKSQAALGRQSPLDLYLIHWPGAQGRKREDPQNALLRKESWRALEQLYSEGKVKAIGVSNYTVRHLEELLTYATVKPHVLQSECHPMLVQKELRAFCKQHHIFFQAYSSLGCGQLLHNHAVVSIATKYSGKTAANILLHWAVQQGIGVIPKASTVNRVQENSEIFDLSISEEDMMLLNESLDTSHHFCWDPTDVA